MSKSNAERQRDYRQRHLKDVDGQAQRLNMLVSVSAKRQLERLAYCYGVTQRAMLERLLDEAERATVAALPAELSGDYYDKQHPLRSSKDLESD